MVLRGSLVKWFLAFAVVLLPNASLGEEIPKTWKRTMTNDPSTNYYLAKITQPLANKEAELLRTVLVSLVAIGSCKGVQVNKSVANFFLTSNGYFKLRGKAWSDAEFLARDSLRNLTYRELAHLCVGLDYLFGPKGAMAHDLVVFKASQPKYPYDSRNPYLKLPDLPQP